MINPNNANPCSEPGTVYPSNNDYEDPDFAFLNEPLEPEVPMKERRVMERAREERLNSSGKTKYRNKLEVSKSNGKKCPEASRVVVCPQGSSSSFNWGSCLGSLILKIIDFFKWILAFLRR